MHDNDKNSKLDGLELLQAIAHTKHEDEHEENEEPTGVADNSSQDTFLEDFEYIIGGKT